MTDDHNETLRAVALETAIDELAEEIRTVEEANVLRAFLPIVRSAFAAVEPTVHREVLEVARGAIPIDSLSARTASRLAGDGDRVRPRRRDGEAWEYLAEVGHAKRLVRRATIDHRYRAHELVDLRLDLANHSPTGVAWGYLGSGPAQLALAILADYTGDDTLAVACHQAFKQDLIAPKPQDKPFRLHGHEIDTWLRNRVRNDHEQRPQREIPGIPA